MSERASMSARDLELPCAGVSVVEVAIGASELGLGLAGGVPGMILADLGATVVRVTGTAPPDVDDHVTWGRAWHRDKQLVRTDDPGDVRARLRDADVALVYGPEELVEERGLGSRDVRTVNPHLVYARCRPSRTAKGVVDDYALLVEANAGLCTQLAGHRPGPIFLDARAAASGAAFLLTTSVLALLYRRARTGDGGWAETSLYDGMLSTLGCMIGRSERAPTEVEAYWEHGSTFPNFLYRCADGELIQVWFGGKGMYAKLLEVLGDEPSTEGYYTDQVKGALNARAIRWRSFFAAQPRSAWIEQLRAAGIPCEPVLAPGDALVDPHLGETGLAVSRLENDHRDVVVGNPISIGPLDANDATETRVDLTVASGVTLGNLLDGLRVLDFSAFVAGPLGAQVLADLGADVLKVEPLEGEAMRAAAYAVAACQRGKRSIALDLTASEARPVVERLVKWADVILHNFRVGVSERLGIDERTVARLNPRAVYCHASAFGTDGPRATFAGNDALMQAVTGLERAVGGVDNDPLAPTWIPIDMAGGWLTAVGMLAGLYARARSGGGERVATSLLGAGMLLQSGVFQRDGACVRGPELDARQTGYGPGYRIYEGHDGQWFALVLPDGASWTRLRGVPEASALPSEYAPLRGGTVDALARDAEAVLERAFATAPAADWVKRLRALDLLAELIEPMSRDDFRRAILDDPVNRQLGRVATFETPEWGHFEQIGPLLRTGPSAAEGPLLVLPAVGEHTREVLAALGFTSEEIDRLIAAKVVRQP
jgi:crotonobetainyl-CoA:carnitine CoA-transferase CaiB-like acyl-CoA transferase